MLRDCPRCSEPDPAIKRSLTRDGFKWRIKCVKCKCQTGLFLAEPKAVANWNTAELRPNRNTLHKPKRQPDYVYKGKNAFLFSSHVEGKCHSCRDQVEAGEDAVHIPAGESGQRFYHKICFLHLPGAKVK